MSKERITFNWSAIGSKIKEQEAKRPKKVVTPPDVRIYKPKLKDDGTTQVLFRFIPVPDFDIPYLKTFHHNFNYGKKYLSEMCLCTLGQECPVCQEYFDIYKTGDTKFASKVKRKEKYYGNILIINDPQTPENNGKVFIFQYGFIIQQKIMAKIAPPEDGFDAPVHVFDYYDGANFKLDIKTESIDFGEGGKPAPNYDNSEFKEVSPISKWDAINKKLVPLTDDEINNLHHEKRITVADFASTDKFKTVEELNIKLDAIFQQSEVSTNRNSTNSTKTDKVESEQKEESKPSQSNESVESAPEMNIVDSPDEDEFVNKLRNGS